MNTLNLASTLNFLGFTVGIALYAILLAMVFRHPAAAARKKGDTSFYAKFNLLLAATAVLGLAWNFISLFELVWKDFLNAAFSPYLAAIAYSALGFLPAVVVNSEWRAAIDKPILNIRRLTIAAYFLSSLAAFLHFYSAFVYNSAPFALWILTTGYLLILVVLYVLTRETSVERKTVWAAALAIFAVSAIHLSHPHNENESWWLIELVGHQASLAFVFVILYQNFRFAFADLFLKRALSLVLLAALVFGLYVLVAAPLVSLHESHPQPDAQRIAVILILWMLTALVYPLLHQFAVWMVDKVLLRRADYAEFKKEIALALAKQENVETILDRIREKLAAVLTAGKSSVEEISEPFRAGNSSVEYAGSESEILISTADAPQYKIVLREFAGGRQLLSEEIEMLEAVALETARRIDVLRVSHERCERELREQEFSSLAVEAELRALRAQINPHFLFNALTTIGYLINAAPERALQTLMQLTGLLRGVLRSTGEFQTLGEELNLIRAYLEIEQARFEERLKVEIDIPDELLSVRIPSLILQPIIENAVKHGISPKKDGGTIEITARRDKHKFILQVADTGIGIGEPELSRRRANRVGLNNIEQRLHLYFNGAVNLTINSKINYGTTIEIQIDSSVLESHQQQRLSERAFI